MILATGAHERPLVFGNNDLPGVMLASAVSAYIHRYGVLPGRDAVLFTNNDRAIRRPSIWPIAAPGRGGCPRPGRRHPAGRRPAPGVTVMAGAVVMAAHGKRRSRPSTCTHAKGQCGGRVATLPCDLLAMSGG